MVVVVVVVVIVVVRVARAVGCGDGSDVASLPRFQLLHAIAVFQLLQASALSRHTRAPCLVCCTVCRAYKVLSLYFFGVYLHQAYVASQSDATIKLYNQTSNFVRYEVPECVPHIKGLGEMLTSLNATNDFGAFVREMRVKFKQTC
jgi:hypothetical protein